MAVAKQSRRETFIIKFGRGAVPPGGSREFKANLKMLIAGKAVPAQMVADTPGGKAKGKVVVKTETVTNADGSTKTTTTVSVEGQAEGHL